MPPETAPCGPIGWHAVSRFAIWTPPRPCREISMTRMLPQLLAVAGPLASNSLPLKP